MSSYFVESVHTLTSTGKTRKGALLQEVARQFEHKVLADEEALANLMLSLKHLVETCNKRYKGTEVHFTCHYDAGAISAYNGNPGNAPDIFIISYAPMGERLHASTVRNLISNTVNNIDVETLKAYHKEGGRHV